jgi:hypothetical protein
LSTFALGGSSSGRGGFLVPALRYGDLALLALALPVFIVANLPILGYAAAAGAWIIVRALGLAADRRAASALAAGRRNAAMGTVAAATLGRVWLMALAILLVGLLADRESGLAAAVLAAVLVTVHLGARALERLFAEEGEDE